MSGTQQNDVAGFSPFCWLVSSGLFGSLLLRFLPHRPGLPPGLSLPWSVPGCFYCQAPGSRQWKRPLRSLHAVIPPALSQVPALPACLPVRLWNCSWLFLWLV